MTEPGSGTIPGARVSVPLPVSDNTAYPYRYFFSIAHPVGFGSCVLNYDVPIGTETQVFEAIDHVAKNVGISTAGLTTLCTKLVARPHRHREVMTVPVSDNTEFPYRYRLTFARSGMLGFGLVVLNFPYLIDRHDRVVVAANNVGKQAKDNNIGLIDFQLIAGPSQDVIDRTES